MKDMFKWPFAIAAVLVVTRIVTEQMGMPDTVNNLISVAALYVLIAPMYFALKIAKSNEPHPYKNLLKTVALFTVLVRGLLVIPTYWMAYGFNWTALRFSVAGGGIVGPDVSMAFVIGYPFVALAFWVAASVLVGGGVGSAIIANTRRAAL